MLVSSLTLIKKYGDPRVNTVEWERKNLVVYHVPDFIQQANAFIPRAIYMHRDFCHAFEVWMRALIANEVINEIKHYDGCWNIRKKKGSKSLSIHAFGFAVDFNAAHNPYGLSKDQCIKKGLTPFSDKFIETSRPFVDCGADWINPKDGMHFQIKNT